MADWPMGHRIPPANGDFLKGVHGGDKKPPTTPQFPIVHDTSNHDGSGGWTKGYNAPKPRQPK